MTGHQGSSPEAERIQAPLHGSKPVGLIDYHLIHSAEPSDHPADAHPRGNAGRYRQVVNFDRGKSKGLLDFNGKADGFVHWRRRIASYLSDEDVTYGQLIDWARQQPGAITEKVEDKDACDISTKIGLDVKEFSRMLYNFLCTRFGKTMEFRMDSAGPWPRALAGIVRRVRRSGRRDD